VTRVALTRFFAVVLLQYRPIYCKHARRTRNLSYCSRDARKPIAVPVQ